MWEQQAIVAPQQRRSGEIGYVSAEPAFVLDEPVEDQNEEESVAAPSLAATPLFWIAVTGWLLAAILLGLLLIHNG